jgi:hypothetical protein
MSRLQHPWADPKRACRIPGRSLVVRRPACMLTAISAGFTRPSRTSSSLQSKTLALLQCTLLLVLHPSIFLTGTPYPPYLDHPLAHPPRL